MPRIGEVPTVEDFVRVERADTPSFTADGGALAFRWNTSGSPQAYLRALADGSLQQLTDTGGVAYSVRWRPQHDDALVVTDDDGEL